MALTTIDNGSIAKSSVLNDNFVFLDEKISKTAQTLDAKISMVTNTSSSVSSNLATTQTTVSNIQDELSTLTTTTEGKASKDLSDVTFTSAFIAKIVNLIVPNVSKRYTISSGFVAPSAGWVFLRNQEESRCYITIDGVDFDYTYDWGDGGSEDSLNWFVGKGQKVEFRGRIGTAYFIPSKLSV